MKIPLSLQNLICAYAFILLLPAAASGQTWQLVWTDDFETDTLDATKWSYQIGTGASEGLNSWGNNELQYYTDRDENIFLEDGMLHIVARQEQFSNRNYTSARIRTIHNGDWRYGKFEIRAKMPKGKGMWPAIWMLPTDKVYGGWPRSGEIDIMELVGHIPEEIHGTVHYGPAWPDNQMRGGSYSLNSGDFSDDFHTFSIIWDPGRIRWYIDDQFYYMVTTSNLAPHPWPFDQDFHMLLNVAVGGNWPGNPDQSTQFPQEMIVDYVHIYEDKELTSISDPEEIPDQAELHQNYPNPFNPETNISFELREFSHVTLDVYDIMGRKVSTVADRPFSAGPHTVRFSARELSSGTYIYRLSTGTVQKFRSMQVIR